MNQLTHTTWRPLQCTDIVEVGWGKTMSTKATLDGTGLLTLESRQSNSGWWGPLRGHILVIGFASDRQAVWVSPMFECPTRGAAWESSRAHEGRCTFTVRVPSDVHARIAILEVLQSDNVDYLVLRRRLRRMIRARSAHAQQPARGVRVAPERGHVRPVHHSALLHDRDVIGDREHQPKILLDEDEGNVLPLQRAEHRGNRIYDGGGQSV
jgi:hypothetical protein